MLDRYMQIRYCPFCGGEFTDPPVLSRTDNETEICPDCGMREALRAAGFSDEVTGRMLEDINTERLWLDEDYNSF